MLTHNTITYVSPCPCVLALGCFDGVHSGHREVISTAKAIATAIVNAFTSQANAMRNAGASLISSLNTGMSSGRSAAVSTARAIAESIVDAMESKESAMRRAGRELIRAFNDGFDSGESAAVSAAQSIAKAMVDALDGKAGDFKTVGVNMASGLKEGFLSQESSIKSSVNSMIDRIVSSAKSRQKIASPSKVWAEIGDFMAQGLGVGFTDEMKNVTRDITDSIPTSAGTMAAGGMRNASTTDNMVSAFKEALYQVKIELDDEVAGRFVDKTVTRLIYT